MKYMMRPIISNILLTIESILLFLITGMFILKLTILNENYIIKKLDKTNYYEAVYNETKDTISYIARKSSISERIINNVFTQENIKKDVNKFIKNSYQGKKVEINTELLKENINRNIETYEEEKNIVLDDSVKRHFVNKVTETYKNEITLMNNYEKESKTISKYSSLNNTLLLLFIVDLIVLLIINKKIFRKAEYHIILLSSSISLLLTFIYTKLLNLNKIFIYNENVSKVIRKVVINPTYILFIFIIIYLIGGVYLLKSKKKEK
jgi:hypothetical protein